MRFFATAWFALSAIALSGANAAEDCGSADRSQTLAGVLGDFEFVVDPQDPAGNLIYVSNLGDGTSDVVVARINASTGAVVNGSLTTVANNFRGQTAINGPEFVQKPTGELGIVYAGDGGVRAVFRPAQPAAWNDFRFDVAGALVRGQPPLLPVTSDGAYPTPPLPLGQSTYGQWMGNCVDVCYGALDGASTTDVAVLESRGLTVFTSVQGPHDGYIYISGCSAPRSCGVYEALLDNAGGFAAGSVRKLASVNAPATADSLVAAVHPVTGSTVIFANEGGIGAVVNVWEQPASGGLLTLIGSIPVISSRRFRALAGNNSVVLHYVIRTGTNAGSYTIPVTASGGALSVGASTKIGTANGGSELAWLPTANRWALFFRTPSNQFTRCWVAP